MAQFLQKEIDTQNMNSVVAALTTGIDAAVSHSQQVQHQQLGTKRFSMIGALSGESLGRLGSKRNGSFIWKIVNEKQNLPRKALKSLPRN